MRLEHMTARESLSPEKNTLRRQRAGRRWKGVRYRPRSRSWRWSYRSPTWATTSSTTCSMSASLMQYGRHTRMRRIDQPIADVDAGVRPRALRQVLDDLREPALSLHQQHVAEADVLLQ